MSSYQLIDLVEATEWYVYLLSLDEYSPHALLGVGGGRSVTVPSGSLRST